MPSFAQTHVQVATLNTFQEYDYGTAAGISEAVTTIAGPVIASMMAAPLLATRNQDFWGNVRLPAIELLENGSNGDSNTDNG